MIYCTHVSANPAFRIITPESIVTARDLDIVWVEQTPPNDDYAFVVDSKGRVLKVEKYRICAKIIN